MIEIEKADNDTFLFRVKTAEGLTLMESIAFNSKEELEATVKQLTPLTDARVVIERKTNHQGNFLFNLKDKNGKIIGNSLLYDSEAGMENGITNIKNRIASLSKPD